MIAEITDILLVDDEPAFHTDLVQEIEFSLANRNLRTHYAADGERALALYAAHPGIRLAILDTELKPTNERGYEILDRLRERGYKGPALGRSGKSGYKHQWKKRDATFLDKNARRSVFIDTLKRLLDSSNP